MADYINKIKVENVSHDVLDKRIDAIVEGSGYKGITIKSNVKVGANVRIGSLITIGSDAGVFDTVVIGTDDYMIEGDPTGKVIIGGYNKYIPGSGVPVDDIYMLGSGSEEKAMLKFGLGAPTAKVAEYMASGEDNWNMGICIGKNVLIGNNVKLAAGRQGGLYFYDGLVWNSISYSPVSFYDYDPEDTYYYGQSNPNNWLSMMMSDDNLTALY